MRAWLVVGAVSIASVVVTTCAGSEPTVDPSSVQRLSVRIIDEHPHDPESFTEGLVFVGDRLYESSGGYGNSDVREVDPESGQVLATGPLDPKLFAEGLGSWSGGLVQLTWRERTVLRWDTELAAGTPGRIAEDGWGLTADDEHLISSDGTATIRFRDPVTLETIRSVEVRRDGRPVTKINELEYVDGVIWANVWMTDDVIRIDPDSGAVTGVVDASALARATEPRADPDAVLNGIAHRPGDPPDRLWMTGKWWPSMFEVEVTAQR